MTTRGIRGATTVAADDAQLILEATSELLGAILKANPAMKPDDIASVVFTTTHDLCATFPPRAARQMDWGKVPMLCASEIPVPGSLPRVIRVLAHWNTNRSQSEITHVYLREAVSLRPDLVAAQ